MDINVSEEHATSILRVEPSIVTMQSDYTGRIQRRQSFRSMGEETNLFQDNRNSGWELQEQSTALAGTNILMSQEGYGTVCILNSVMTQMPTI